MGGFKQTPINFMDRNGPVNGKFGLYIPSAIFFAELDFEHSFSGK